MTTAIAAAVDASVVVVLALLACGACRRRSAALRHAILAASLFAAAAAPVFETLLPHWELPVLSSSTRIPASDRTMTSELPPAAASSVTVTPDRARLTGTELVWAVWGAGVVLMMAGLLASLVRLFSLMWRCRPTESTTWRERAKALSMQYGLSRPVVVLESRDQPLLVTCGLFQPRIIVPAGAAAWSPDRIEVVLAHELAHIVRRDWLLLIAARTILAAYWFNPLIWMACRRLRDESEHACDDAVLRRGVPATDYASHLLAIARHVRSVSGGWASAPAVVSTSTLERRIAAMFNVSRNHGPLTRVSLAGTLLAMSVVSAPLAAVTLTEKGEPATLPVTAGHDIRLTAPVVPEVRVAPAPILHRANAAATTLTTATPATPAPAPQTPASLSGSVRDATGAFVPGVVVTLVNVSAKTQSVTTTDSVGRFSFRGVPPSQYELSASIPGFARHLESFTLEGGQELQRSVVLQIGALTEQVRVTCPAGGAAVLPRGGASIVAFERRATISLGTKGRTFVTPVALAAQAPPVRVGGQIFASRRIKDAIPVCPNVPLPSGGAVVILDVTIGVDGLVRDVAVLRAGELPQLVDSAREAVRQWQFTPTRLNGQPTPVVAVITVEYRRQ